MKCFVKTAGVLLLAVKAYGDYTYGEFYGSTVALSEFILFQRPDTLSTALRRVLPGAEIVIIARTDSVTIENRMVTDWYEVCCETDGSSQTGFATGTNFACTSQGLSDECVLVFGVTGCNPETGSYNGLGRIVCNGEVLAEAEIEPPRDSFGDGTRFYYCVESALVETAGFSDLAGMAVISFIYGACGYENRETAVLWTGENIVCAPYTSTVSEAFVFHFAEKYILPGEPGGMENTLTILTTSEMWNEDTQSYDLEDETAKSYNWTGDGFDLMPSETEPSPEH